MELMVMLFLIYSNFLFVPTSQYATAKPTNTAPTIKSSSDFSEDKE